MLLVEYLQVRRWQLATSKRTPAASAPGSVMMMSVIVAVVWSGTEWNGRRRRTGTRVSYHIGCRREDPSRPGRARAIRQPSRRKGSPRKWL